MREKIVTAIALIGAAGLLLLFASPTYRQGEPSVAGKPAPDFSFTLDGKPAKLSDLRGKVVVLNFWATWCPPCVDEMPSLDALHAAIAPQGGMVLGISVDDDHAAYEAFLQRLHIRFPNYRDPDKRINADYGSYMFPETYIIAPDGRIARKVIGPQNWTDRALVSYIQTLLDTARR
ncbi:MAG: TlpA family protein disulfide reductase [Verrucomicrobiales bacterium]|nr:TlpA family protein disulfide reductase [Verrucomicrobiales bacterium]